MHDLDALNGLFGDAVTIADDRVTVSRPEALASDTMDELVRAAVFGEGTAKEYARWLIWEIGQAVGVRPSSIHDLYMARGRGEVHGFTVPAINVRGASYDTARARSSARRSRMKAGAFILEIARSEIAYTDQRPAEYVAVMLAAALREGFRGPLFIQGDHFQVNHKKYATNPKPEVDAVKALVREAVGAGFYNIDIDTSTLVDLSKPTLDEQQRLNYEVGIDILQDVRRLEPDGVTISVGGEIGEVGTENSTVEELRAYMDGFNAALPKGMDGLSKISVQSGTSHGGTVLADGSIAEVKLDLDTLETLGKVARDEYGLSPAPCSTARPRCRTRRSTTSRSARRRRSISRRTSRTCCSIIFRTRCARRSTSGCARTRRTSASRPIPTSSSSTRRARRRSARSSGSSGICRPT